MKKTGITLALLLATSLAAHAQSVPSANIMGYNRNQLPPTGKLIIVGSAFEGPNGVPTLNSIFGTSQLAQGVTPTLCDKVIVWDVVSQDYITFAQKSITHSFYLTTAWTGATQDDYEIPLGSAIWVQSKPSASLTNEFLFSGNVPLQDSITNSITGNSGRPLNLICNPYPTTKTIAELISSSDGATAGVTPTLCDVIIVWDVATQTYVTLGLKLTDGLWHYTTAWTAPAPEIEILPGQGFWYGARNSFDWAEARGFDL